MNNVPERQIVVALPGYVASQCHHSLYIIHYPSWLLFLNWLAIRRWLNLIN